VSETRASLDRLARHGIRPNRELGQNFLVDDNILEVIGRTAELDPDDVVVEIGGGLGILSSYLAPRVRHLHVIETDRKLEPVLREALAGRERKTTILIADVMRTRLSGLDPLPAKVVANLPYGVATPALLKTIDELPDTRLWCVMVQREIADRLAAQPGTKAYGIPSVLVQLACEVEIVRRRVRGASETLAVQVANAVSRLRDSDVQKPPGIAEAIDWLAALSLLGIERLDAAAVELTLGSVLKYSDDQEVIRAAGLEQLVRSGD